MKWRAVPGYEGSYEVSGTGSVRSLTRIDHRGAPRVGQPIATWICPSNGYPTVRLSRDGRKRTRTVHSLVAEAFLGPRPAGQEVRHLNGVRTDPRLTNLAYGTRSDNVRDAVRHGTHRQAAQTHCLRGHEFTEANTYITRDGRRDCRPCRAVRQGKSRGRPAA